MIPKNLEEQKRISRLEELRKYETEHPIRFLAKLTLLPGYMIRTVRAMPDVWISEREKRYANAISLGIEVARAGLYCYGALRIAEGIFR